MPPILPSDMCTVFVRQCVPYSAWYLILYRVTCLYDGGHQLAGRGYNLLLVARSKEGLKRAAKELREASRCVFPMQRLVTIQHGKYCTRMVYWQSFACLDLR